MPGMSESAEEKPSLCDIAKAFLAYLCKELPGHIRTKSLSLTVVNSPQNTSVQNTFKKMYFSPIATW